MRKLRYAVVPVLIAMLATATVVVGTGARFGAVLSGREEVPPVQTAGRGLAVFRLTDDGKALRFNLYVFNLNAAITQAHIHVKPSGQPSGGVVADLAIFGPTDGSGGSVAFDGRLASGFITAFNLKGSLLNQPIDALLDEIRAGNAYVNVHTVGHPSGEIRGQLRFQAIEGGDDE